jgi:hypothetical protein
MSRRFVVALLLGALALAPSFAGAEEDSGSLEQLVAGTAHTKAEHQALAKYYEAQAAEAREVASRHQAIGRAYLGSKGANGKTLQGHCQKIAEQQEAMAKEYNALAELHEAEAKKAAQ